MLGTRQAVLLFSLELDEILALSDRIAVIYEGEIVGIIKRQEATEEMLGLMMAVCKDGNSVKKPKGGFKCRIIKSGGLHW